jgi:hypothetical protein
MPTLDLPDLNSENGRRIAWLRIAKVMAWPADPERQNRLEFSTAGKQMVEGSAPWQAIFEEFGGVAASRSLPSHQTIIDEFRDTFAGWFTTANVFYLIYRASRPNSGFSNISINKATFAVKTIKTTMPPPYDRWTPKHRVHLTRVWSAYKPVAHLCEPIVARITSSRRLIDALDEILAEARWLPGVGTRLP